MYEEELREELCFARNREKRLQWTVTTVLCAAFFIAGMLMEAERLKDRVVANTVEIGSVKTTLAKIETKLDRVLEERRHD